MLNCSFVAVIRPTLFYRGIGQTPCSYEHYLVFNNIVANISMKKN